MRVEKRTYEKEDTLNKFIATHDFYRCDQCGEQQYTGCTMFSCRTRDYDLCENCFATGEKVEENKEINRELIEFEIEDLLEEAAIKIEKIQIEKDQIVGVVDGMEKNIDAMEEMEKKIGDKNAQEIIETMEKVKEVMEVLKEDLTPKNCPVNHALFMFATTHENLCCYKCRKFTNKNTNMYGCKICSFYLCWDCYGCQNAEGEIYLLEEKLEQLEEKLDDPNQKAVIEEMIEKLEEKKDEVKVIEEHIEGVTGVFEEVIELIEENQESIVAEKNKQNSMKKFISLLQSKKEAMTENELLQNGIEDSVINKIDDLIQHVSIDLDANGNKLYKYSNIKGDHAIVVNLNGFLHLVTIVEISSDHQSVKYKYRDAITRDPYQWIRTDDPRFLKTLPKGFKLGEKYTNLLTSILVHNPWRFVLDDDWNVYLSGDLTDEIKIGWKLIAINGVTIHEINEEKMWKIYKIQPHCTTLTFVTKWICNYI